MPFLSSLHPQNMYQKTGHEIISRALAVFKSY